MKVINSISYLIFLCSITVVLCRPVLSSPEEQEEEDVKPNLLIIMTDEHNMRTLGCYRQLMERNQRYIWGEGVKVNTPNIDSLARDGVLFTNFNAATPSCTPSRASFMTGLYPKSTGAHTNRKRMNDNLKTFATILKQNAGYSNTYIGKWHLNGTEKPGFGKDRNNRNYGFHDIKYQFNRGHYKWFEVDAQSNLQAYMFAAKDRFRGRETKNYATDFLFDEAISVMKHEIKESNPFAIMLSIPDPHGPDVVRNPYQDPFKNMHFQLPRTGKAAYRKSPANPQWSSVKLKNLKNAEKKIRIIESDKQRQNMMQSYFGMVKLIDDRIGDVLRLLKQKRQENNTILVFTSDHGDMMWEHGRINKGLPYKTSAGVPCIIRYPKKIKKGKIIHTSYASPDFAPTILGLMGVSSRHEWHGLDGSEEILSHESVTNREQIRFSTFFNKAGAWSAAIDREYKLVISDSDPPFLFDMKKDPDEMINYYNYDETYKNITEGLRDALIDGIEDYHLTLKYQDTYFLDRPTCYDTEDQIPMLKFRVCKDLTNVKYKHHCQKDEVADFCPTACGKCCEDSPGLIKIDKNVKRCSDIKNMAGRPCDATKVRQFCPESCGMCG